MRTQACSSRTWMRRPCGPRSTCWRVRLPAVAAWGPGTGFVLLRPACCASAPIPPPARSPCRALPRAHGQRVDARGAHHLLRHLVPRGALYRPVRHYLIAYRLPLSLRSVLCCVQVCLTSLCVWPPCTRSTARKNIHFVSGKAAKAALLEVRRPGPGPISFLLCPVCQVSGVHTPLWRATCHLSHTPPSLP